MIIPGSAKPSLSKEDLFSIWPELRYLTKSFLLGVRGYAALEGGSANRRGVYDDAIFVIDRKIFKAFNANTDPSEFNEGRAVLQPGVYEYQLGIHNRKAEPPRKHLALVQAAKVKIKRDGQSNIEEGFFGINIHRGGKLSTGSEGCQTIPSDQWPDFISTIEFGVMKPNNTSYIHYKLVEYKINVVTARKS